MPGMLTIGKLTLDAPFYQAGLAGYSDAAMRLIARRHGSPYCVTEAMLDQILLNGGKGLDAARLDPADHPIAGQLMGSFPQEMRQAARLLVEMGYDVIDVNLACPVKKIRKRSRGGHLMQAPEEAKAILDAVRQAVPADVPCTVKLRRGTDDSAEALAHFHAIYEAVLELGYAGATVHGRSVEQKYVGPSNWGFLAELTRAYGRPRVAHDPEGRLFTLMGSGDIWNAGDVFRMMRETGVQGVSIARGCIGNPWIFRQARALLAGDVEGGRRPPRVQEQRQVLLDHFELSLGLHGEHRAGMMMRKFGIKFSRHHPLGPEVARAFIAVHSLADWREVLARYYGEDGPGVVPEGEPAAGGEAEGCETVGEDTALRQA